jgi:DNA-binding CsgD family transcriptional regulator
MAHSQFSDSILVLGATDETGRLADQLERLGDPLFLGMLVGDAKELRLLTAPGGAARAHRAGGAAVARIVLLRVSTAPTVETADHVLEGVTSGERRVRANLAFELARSSQTAIEAVHYIQPALAAEDWFDERQADVMGPFCALATGLLATDALELAVGHLDRALAVARARASTPALALLIAHRGWFHLRGGAVAKAEADARGALELLRAHALPLGRRFALALLVEALIENDQLDAAAQALDDGGRGHEIPPGSTHDPLLEARGMLRVAQGNLSAGLDDLLEFGRRDELSGGSNPLGARWRSSASLVLATLGDRERARHMVAEEIERARRWGAASAIGMALRAVALVADDTPSVERLREAANVLQRSPARLEHARVLIDIGAALRRNNRRAEARRTLQEGLALALSCCAGRLVERARTELRAAGGRSSDAAGGAGRLTASERRVAELAAQGQSNPRIARALFVTRKTVETHLGHCYAKLAISGRAELSRALAAEATHCVGLMGSG